MSLCPVPHFTALRRPPLPVAMRALAFALLLGLPGCRPVDLPVEPAAGRSPGHPRQGHAAGDGAAQVLQARSIQVQDGDSFIVRTSSGSRRTIRLSGIDAPERSQPDADRSRQSLSRLLDGRDLEVHVAKTDPYGRAVAQVFTAGADGNPLDVGLAQIDAGMAWFFRRYQGDLPRAFRERYADAERGARKASRGLWQAADPEPPWDFRRRLQAVRQEVGR